MSLLKPIEFRPVTRQDATIIQKNWGERADNFIYLRSQVLESKALAQAYIDQIFEKPNSKAYHIVFDGHICGLVKAIVTDHHALIGYVIDKPYWGKGLATAAVRFITAKQKSDSSIQRIWATCALENVSSQKVLEKCGYEREGILHNWIIYPAQGDKAHDNYVYFCPSH